MDRSFSERILRIDIPGLRRNTYIFSAIALALAIAFFVGGVFFEDWQWLFWVIAINEMFLATILLGARLRHLSFVEHVQQNLINDARDESPAQSELL